MTAEPSGHEQTIAERVDYTRAHLPADQLDAYDQALREAGRQVADAGDVTALSEVVEQWWWRRGWSTAAVRAGSGSGA